MTARLWQVQAQTSLPVEGMIAQITKMEKSQSAGVSLCLLCPPVTDTQPHHLCRHAPSRPSLMSAGAAHSAGPESGAGKLTQTDATESRHPGLNPTLLTGSEAPLPLSHQAL